MKDRKVIRSGQHGLTNLMDFWNEATGLVDEGRVGDIVYLNFYGP